MPFEGRPGRISASPSKSRPQAGPSDPHPETMTSRFQLRFQSGERAGETVPLSSSSMSVGRNPGVDILVSDASVSGRHAEFLVDGEGVLLRDLGSTNGTRVAGRQIKESRLAHGDLVRFGGVSLVFEDGEIADTANTMVPKMPKNTGEGDGTASGDQDLGRVSSEALERSGQRSRLGLVLGAVALSAGCAWWFLGRGPLGSSAGGTRGVAAVAGNLLEEGYSFEGDASHWSPDESCPVAFLVRAGAGRSGEAGLSLDLSPAEWARHRSDVQSVRGRKQLTLVAWTRGGGDLTCALGLEFSGPSAGAVTAWAPIDSLSTGFERSVLTANVPPGYDHVRAVLFARAAADEEGGEGGEVEVDDVSLVAGPGGTDAAGGPAAPVTLAEYKLHTLGTPPSSALLHKAGRTFFTELRFVDESDQSGGTGLALELGVLPTGIALRSTQTTPARMVVRLEPGALREFVATVGVDASGGALGGYRTHALEFERDGVISLLAGKGLDLVCWKFDEPVSVRGSVANGGLLVEAQLTAGGGFLLQLSFRDEKLEAGNLAHGARNFERAGAFGECLSTWGRLLDEYPFEDVLVAEAEEARGRLVSAGLAEVTALERRVERARFFQLADLFRLCHGDAVAIATTYKGSEVARAANRLTDAVNGDLRLLDSERDAGERVRLQAILDVLEYTEADGIAKTLRGYMDQQYGEAE